MLNPKKPSGPTSDADFLGWQKSATGTIIPLFNITDPRHPSYRSTVSDTTLRSMRLRVPEAQSPYGETGPSPWHNFGVELNRAATAREAIEIAGLDYTVVKKPGERKTGAERDAYVTVRTDTGEILGNVGKDYDPIQNRDAFAFCDALVDTQGAAYETAGVIGRGERIWILARLPGYIGVHGNDIVNKYLLLTNRHDGGISVQVKLAPIRVVCNNTLTTAMQGQGEHIAPHSPDAGSDLNHAYALLETSNSVFDRLGGIFNRMATKRISERELKKYVFALVPDGAEGEDNARAKKIRDDMLQLHESGRGAYLARGTLWGAFNSVTEYTDYMMLDGDPAARLNSIWFGRGEQFKVGAFNLAERMMQA